MNKIRFYFCTLILIVLQTGCDTDEYEYIPKSWYLNYHNGDTLIYRSNLNNTDTFYLEQIETDFYISDKKYHYERIVNSFVLIDSNNQDFRKDNYIKITTGYLSLNWLLFGSYNNYFHRMVSEKYTLNGKVYDVYSLPRDTFFLESDTINKLLYHGKYGVMRYDYKTGEYFELQIK